MDLNLSALTIDNVILIVAVLLGISVAAGKLSARYGVPALLLFLVLGMLAGSEGPGGIPFDNPRLAQSVGTVALALILFSGGLSTDWQRVRPIVRPALTLATGGVVMTAVLMAAFAHYVLGYSWLEGMLLGSIISSTDAAATFSILRSRSVRLQEPIEPLLELESGSNDPMAIFLTVAFTGLVGNPEGSLVDVLPFFLTQMSLGTAFGFAGGYALRWSINHARLQIEGLYPMLTLAGCFLIYGLTATLSGSGYLAVYIAGIIVAYGNFIHRNSLIRFHDALAWLSQIAIFLVLGLLVSPARLWQVSGAGMLTAGALMFVARPLSVYTGMAFDKMSWRAKTLVAWVGLRGAVPIILATFPLVAGLDRTQNIFSLVFFVVITSVLVQGLSITWAGKRLGVLADAAPKRQYPLEYNAAHDLKGALEEVTIPPDAAACGKTLLDLRLPEGSLIVLINREGEFIVPSGGATLAEGDDLLVLAARDQMDELRRLLTEPEPPRPRQRGRGASAGDGHAGDGHAGDEHVDGADGAERAESGEEQKLTGS